MFSLFLLASAAVAAPAEKDKPLVELFEEDTAPLIAGLNQVSGPSTVEREDKDVYLGKHSLRVTPQQRYSPSLPGWNFQIAEKPGPGQYRYLRFAWKKDGGQGVMIQLCQTDGANQDWNHRYVAGVNAAGWQPSIIVDPKIPTTWKVVTRDLFKDFGAIRINGIALTAMDGTTAWFDHLYLARSLDDFAAIDAVGRDVAPLKDDLTDARLRGAWDALADEDAAKALRAQRTLFAAATQSLPLAKEKLRPVELDAEEKQFLFWIRDLDDDEFEVREAASDKLAKAGKAAFPPMRRALAATPPTEVRRRLDALLRNAPVEAPAADQVRALRAVEVLERVGSPEATDVLKRLTKGDSGAELTEAAKAALERLAKKK
jgi:hypothetical protein